VSGIIIRIICKMTINVKRLFLLNYCRVCCILEFVVSYSLFGSMLISFN